MSDNKTCEDCYWWEDSTGVCGNKESIYFAEYWCNGCNELDGDWK